MNEPFPIAPVNVPYITTDQMHEVDRAMEEDYGISLLQMMENAGRNLAEVVIRSVLDGSPEGKNVLVAVGPGGNGGGALSGARHLHNRGCDVSVVLAASESKLSDATLRQLNSIQAIGIPVAAFTEHQNSIVPIEKVDAIVDGLLGYSINGNPRGLIAAAIERINESGIPVVSNDIPSGIDSTTGEIFQPAIKANFTVTIAAPKTGFKVPGARQRSGVLFLGDISVPRELYRKSLGIEMLEMFSTGSIVKIDV